ncbi:MAG: hypothetical protein HQQ73_06345 [Desulfobulbaceae bacterium]|nr:hypothetical protein [Desulfobulbaceae bacterium]
MQTPPSTSPPVPSQTPSHLTTHNAAVVIRERIKEKRLFEAQFLFGLLDEDDLPPQERQTLEQELEGLLTVVRDLQLQANKYLAEEEYVLARKMHREMERIAIDVPGLENGKRYVEEQSQVAGERVLAAKQDLPVQKDEDGVTEALSASDSSQEGRALALRLQSWQSTAKKGSGRISIGKLLIAVVVLVLFAVVILFFSLMQREYSNASLKARATGDITIKPLSVRQGESPPASSDQLQQPAESSAASPSVTITIGTLSVESGSMP